LDLDVGIKCLGTAPAVCEDGKPRRRKPWRERDSLRGKREVKKKEKEEEKAR
jgi:hypothetical protein